MATTLLLDPLTWDLVLDSAGNVAVVSNPTSLAQDAASAIKTFLGEYYWDTTVGVPYLTEILGQTPPLTVVRQQLINAALTVPDVASAQVFISSFTNRAIAGQVQVISTSGQISASDFSVVSPQGGG